MLRHIIATGVALAVSTASISAADLNALNPDLVAKGMGMSAISYKCVRDAFGGETDKQLVAVLNTMKTIDVNNLTPDQATVAACVNLDPFAWDTGDGLTPDEQWAIDTIHADEAKYNNQ
jgi:hypothetical protein